MMSRAIYCPYCGTSHPSHHSHLDDLPSTPTQDWLKEHPLGISVPVSDDTRRLDWLEKHPLGIKFHLAAMRWKAERDDVSYLPTSFETARAAIDAAMEAERTEEGK
jgi:hypothetical protein